MAEETRYPREDGDFIVLGPEVFTDREGSVICWKGQNYVPQKEPAPGPAPDQGERDVESWPNERGVEQMVPYTELGEDVKEFDRIVVGAIADALTRDESSTEGGARPCRHDSTRVDGWLDDHCLRCGSAGYFKNGRYVDPTGKPSKGHPSGKTLIWPAQSEGAGEALTGPRLTHGRHCNCSSCARQDWTDPKLAGCGMHGPTCPPRYAPYRGFNLGDRTPAPDTPTEEEGT